MTDFDKIDTSKLTPKQLEFYKITKVTYDNDFVADVDINTLRIYYTNDFYFVMSKLLKAGKSPIEAYNSLGFDTKVLGEDRAYKAAQRAREKAKKPNYGIDYKDFDGSITRDKMGELSPQEETAYWKARALYCEKAMQLKKKIVSQLAEKGILSKARN